MSEMQSEVHNDKLSHKAAYKQAKLNSTITTPHRIYTTGTLNQIQESFTVSVAYFEAHLIRGNQLVKPGFPGAEQVWFQTIQM